MATPLGYIKSALTDAIDTHRLQQKKIEKIHITTVTKDDLSGGFNPSNLTEHTHTSDHHSMEVLMATSALKVIADVESGGCVTIDDVPHWDGVYSRRNPSLDMFDTPTESPLIVVSVDQKDVKLSMTDSDIVYGLIHEEVERYRQFGRSPLYHINLQHKEHWGARIRTKPSAALVEELLAEGFQDAQACIEQMRIDYSPSLPKQSPYAELAI